MSVSSRGVVLEHLAFADAAAIRREEESGPIAPPGPFEATEARSPLRGALLERAGRRGCRIVNSHPAHVPLRSDRMKRAEIDVRPAPDREHVETPAELVAAAPVRHEPVKSGVVIPCVFRLVQVACPGVDHPGLMREAAEIREDRRVAFFGSNLEAPAVPLSRSVDLFIGDPRAPRCQTARAVTLRSRER